MLPDHQTSYIQKKGTQGWTLDTVIGRSEQPINCSVRTLYRKFKNGEFNVLDLPMKGKRKPNGHQEKRGRQAYKRTIRERNTRYQNFDEEFGHLEGEHHCWSETQERCDYASRATIQSHHYLKTCW